MEQIKNYQANTTKLPFARMSVPVHATNSILYLLVDGNDKKVFVVVKCYALRKAKIRSYFLPRLKNKAVRSTLEGGFFTVYFLVHQSSRFLSRAIAMTVSR